MSQSAATETYHDPTTLVDTNWVAQHLKDPKVRIAEVDYDPAANYALGHIPGAVLLDWKKDMNDPVARDILSKAQAEEILSRNGVGPDTTLILYGDFNNWFAAYAFWDLKYYGVKDVRLMNGGRKKWLLEDKPIDKEVPTYPKTSFVASSPDESIRAYKDHVRESIGKPHKVLVDVRGPKEFSGEILAPPEYPTEHAQRGGHIPTAINIPWAQAVNDADGTFKTRDQLEQVYSSKGVKPEAEVITYCRIGERSSFTWYVLKYLLGYPDVRNYDGSWTEWGNSVRYPIEK
ncbi:MAG TPA: sulfurtransferase [Nitrososphaerales archaeon]|nr:sulfurtransferase [Nitrososphaerales archaeon]